MKLLEVTSSADSREFLEMAVHLYKQEKNWIRPLDADINGLFDPKVNKLFRRGAEAKRWLLKDDHGHTIGRIAAFTNPKWKDKQPTGGMGFFECVDDQKAAFLLFDTAKAWLKEKGMEAMDGPVNFGERDKWWGLLVDGFSPANYNMPWNFPYYQKFFEDYGFKIYFKQYTYMRQVKGVDFDPKFHKRAAITIDDPDYDYRYLKGKELSEKFPEYFTTVYNKAWARHMGKSMSIKEAQVMLKKLKPVVDEKLIYFGFFKGEPVSFFISIPELNQIFKYVNGKLDWIGKMKFLYHKLFNPPEKMLGLVFGVVPEHQGKGVESAMVKKYNEMSNQKSFPYETIEMNWIGDFSPKMMRVCEQLNAIIYKTHHTYRYLFDREKPFERHKIFE
ncbi:GNAT family N-acetyltransferase [Echinicola sediminis]